MKRLEDTPERIRRRAHGIKWLRKRGVLAMSIETRREMQKEHAKKMRALGPEHPMSFYWSLISPTGKVYRFKNLRSWIEENQGLFSERDLELVGRTTRIYGSLARLSPRKKHPQELALGWRWHIGGKHYEALASVLANSSTNDTDEA